MMRLLIPLVLAASTLLGTAFAQSPKESIPPTTPNPSEDPTKVVYDLEVSPADEPRPAMKYRLLPNPADLKPGNAATQYYKAFVLEADSPVRTAAYAKLREWLDTPLRDLNIDELGTTLKSIHEDAFYRSIREATYRATCDWEERVEDEGIRVLLPAVNQQRSVGILLVMKARHEIALKNYDEAIQTARDNFTLCYHLQHDGEVIVQALVGIAIVGVMHDHLFLDWIRTPGSPNLYWAFSETPAYFDTRRIIATELRIPEYTLPAMKELDQRAFTIEEANQLAARAFTIDSRRLSGTLEEHDLQRRVDLMAWALQAHGESYGELASAGISHELLDKMPVLQLALLGRWNRYQVLRDDLYKWAAIAYGPDRELSLRKQSETHKRARELAVPFDTFLPALGAMYRAQLRQHRFFSVLRAIEALRLYAARHDRWPESLADVAEVPVPNDPVTNNPFVYSKTGNSATLIMVEHRLGSGIEYEYRLRLRDQNQ